MGKHIGVQIWRPLHSKELGGAKRWNNTLNKSVEVVYLYHYWMVMCESLKMEHVVMVELMIYQIKDQEGIVRQLGGVQNVDHQNDH